MISACGNSDDENVLQDIPWATGEIGFSGADTWMGTSAVYVDGGEVVLFSDSCGGADWCEDCESAGSTALAMTCLSLLLAIAGIVTSVLQLSGQNHIMLKIGGLLSMLFSAVLAIVAFIVYRSCMQAVVDAFSGTLANAISMWLLLIGFVVMLISAITESGAMCCGGEAEGSTNNL